MANRHAFQGESYEAVAELAVQLQPIRPPQAVPDGAVAQVAARTHIGLLAAAVVVLGRPDATLPLKFTTESSSRGWVGRSGVRREIEPVSPISAAELHAGRQKPSSSLKPKNSAEEAESLLRKCQPSLEQGSPNLCCLGPNQRQVRQKKLVATPSLRDSRADSERGHLTTVLASPTTKPQDSEE